MIVYAFYYNPMTEESGDMTMSLHFDRADAEREMEAHKAKEKEQWYKMYVATGEPETEEKYEEPYPFGCFQDWRVGEVEVQGTPKT